MKKLMLAATALMLILAAYLHSRLRVPVVVTAAPAGAPASPSPDARVETAQAPPVTAAPSAADSEAIFAKVVSYEELERLYRGRSSKELEEELLELKEWAKELIDESNRRELHDDEQLRLAEQVRRQVVVAGLLAERALERVSRMPL